MAGDILLTLITFAYCLSSSFIVFANGVLLFLFLSTYYLLLFLIASVNNCYFSFPITNNSLLFAFSGCHLSFITSRAPLTAFWVVFCFLLLVVFYLLFLFIVFCFQCFLWTIKYYSCYVLCLVYVVIFCFSFYLSIFLTLFAYFAYL